MLFGQFASWSRSSLVRLAGLAQPEDWSYRHMTSSQEHPILRNYVIYSFRRAFFQQKVPELQEGGARFSVFNTGLLTPHFEAIYGLFVPQSRGDRSQPWFLKGFYRESDYQLVRFQRLPEPPMYFDDPSDLLYDYRLDLRIQYEHIVGERVERFPEPLRRNEARRAEAVRQAVQHAIFRVRQNYKTAIPQYYWTTREPSDSGKLQLLLPLCLQDVSRADLALSVDRVGDVYRAATVLTLDMAYNNARLITRPDREWLEPIPGPGSETLLVDEAQLDDSESEAE